MKHIKTENSKANDETYNLKTDLLPWLEHHVSLLHVCTQIWLQVPRPRWLSPHPPSGNLVNDGV